MFSDLIEKCSSFQKLAEDKKISVKKNTNPVLQKLSDIEDFDDRIEFAKKQWGKPLGEGSSRTVFGVNEDLIIKIAHNLKGQAQNTVEMDPKTQRSCTNNIVVADAEGKWVIMQNTKPLTKERFKELVGFGFEQFTNALFYKFNNEESDRWPLPRDYEKIEGSQLFVCLAELIFETDQQIGDVGKINSFRELDGRVVLADYGLSREVYKKYYKSDSSSSTSHSPPKTSEK